VRVYEHLRRCCPQICGGLRLIPLERASDLLLSHGTLHHERAAGWSRGAQTARTDTLADAVTSIEYYLERLKMDGIRDNDNVLRVAEISLESLLPAGQGAYLAPQSDIKRSPTFLMDAHCWTHPGWTRVSGHLDTRVPPDELLDDEIVDIFIEEAEKVLGDHPQLLFHATAEVTTDRAALAEMRPRLSHIQRQRAAPGAQQP